MSLSSRAALVGTPRLAGSLRFLVTVLVAEGLAIEGLAAGLVLATATSPCSVATTLYPRAPERYRFARVFACRRRACAARSGLQARERPSTRRRGCETLGTKGGAQGVPWRLNILPGTRKTVWRRSASPPRRRGPRPTAATAPKAS